MILNELKPGKALSDSNSLDKRFYGELLHIIGLAETRDKSKKLIERNKPGERRSGTILEEVIAQLDSLHKSGGPEKPDSYGCMTEEPLFYAALELCITWINRMLFLKLLETQLISWHKGDESYSFLNSDKIKSYNDLDKLFFQVLACRHDDRSDEVKKAFEKVPHLNLSLFKPADIEQATLFIGSLKNTKAIPVFPQTVLKDRQGKKRTGNISTLEYLLEFLNAYHFGSAGLAAEEDGKTFINASVLGLVFEKINGYKDGSFFTPGFITMYMCREAIRKAVVQKFNEIKKWDCTCFEELRNKIEDRKEASDIVNSLTICDPAVGSGHFLVSALNELIAVKHDLKILQDRSGNCLKGYKVEVVNDELVVTDSEGRLFEYNPEDKESRRIQEALFHEKQAIIENCLFGVDINANSVRICRLRLGIELLKNAYYENAIELETLPDIDSNIKCGNSLISRFAPDADLKQVLKQSKWSAERYIYAINACKSTGNKEQKKQIEQLSADIKSDCIRREYSQHEPDVKKTGNLSSDHMDSKIFENAFEWRFEFPEVLNAEGEFAGFDVVIGNPPYGVKLSDSEKQYVKKNLFNSAETAILFLYKGRALLKDKGILSYIIPKAFTYASNYSAIRELFRDELSLIADCHKPWQEVKLEACIAQIEKNRELPCYDSLTVSGHCFVKLTEAPKTLVDDFGFILNGITETEIQLAEKIRSGKLFFGDICTNKRGVGIQSSLLPRGKYRVLGGIDIERQHIRQSQRGYLNDISGVEPNGSIQNNAVIVQNIVAHLANPVGHIKIIAANPPTGKENFIILDTINQFVFNEDVSGSFACALLNSKLINWYVYNFIYARAIRTMHFDNVVTNRIPFPRQYFRQKSLLDSREDPVSDRDIYKLFELTEAEITLIEATFK